MARTNGLEQRCRFTKNAYIYHGSFIRFRKLMMFGSRCDDCPLWSSDLIMFLLLEKPTSEILYRGWRPGTTLDFLCLVWKLQWDDLFSPALSIGQRLSVQEQCMKVEPFR